MQFAKKRKVWWYKSFYGYPWFSSSFTMVINKIVHTEICGNVFQELQTYLLYW